MLFWGGWVYGFVFLVITMAHLTVQLLIEIEGFLWQYLILDSLSWKNILLQLPSYYKLIVIRKKWIRINNIKYTDRSLDEP